MTEIIVSFVLGFVVGNAILFLRARSRMVHEIEESLQSEMNRRSVFVSVEKHDDMFYFYDNETYLFVCRGRSAQELVDAFHDRFPTKRAFIVEGEEDIVKYLDEQLETVLEPKKNLA